MELRSSLGPCVPPRACTVTDLAGLSQNQARRGAWKPFAERLSEILATRGGCLELRSSPGAVRAAAHVWWWPIRAACCK